MTERFKELVSHPPAPPERRFVEAEEWKALLRKEENEAFTQERAARAPDVGLRKRVVLEEVKQADDAGGDLILEFVISTDDVDRDRDTIDPNGWDLTNYRNNPVVLFGHDYRNLPVAQSQRIWVEENKLISRAQFTPEDLYAFGYTVYRMYLGGYMRAVSVGFMPIEYSFVEEEDRPFGIDFKRQELLEYSTVPVPSNPNALVAASADGIDLRPLKSWAEEVLDSWHETKGGVWVPRESVEQIVRTLDTKNSSYSLSASSANPSAQLRWQDVEGLTPEQINDARFRSPIARGPEAEHTTLVSRFFELFCELRSRSHGLTLTRKDGADLGVSVTDLTESALLREAKLLGARLFPEVSAEAFEKLFPELYEGFGKAGRVLSQANENRLRNAADQITEVLAQLEDADEVEEEGAGSGEEARSTESGASPDNHDQGGSENGSGREAGLQPEEGEQAANTTEGQSATTLEEFLADADPAELKSMFRDVFRGEVRRMRSGLD